MNTNTSLGIGLTMFLRDQFSLPAKRIKSSANELQRELAGLTAQLQMERNIGAGMALAGGMALRGIGRVIKEGSEFSFAMKSVQAIAELSNKELTQMTNKIQQLGQDTLFMSNEVADAAKYMGLAGFSFKEIMGAIDATVMVAGATHASLGGEGGVAAIMSNIMRAFMIDPSTAGNATRVADIITTATVQSALEINDLAEALKYTSSTAMDLGVSLEDTVAMIMTLGNAGIRGTMAGTAIENELRYMSRSLSEFGTAKQTESLAKLGLSFTDLKDSAGNLLPITEIFSKMSTAIKTNFGTGNRILVQNLLQNIFGVRGKRSASLLLRDYDTFMKFTKELKTGSMGSSARIMSLMMEDIWGTLERIKGAFENLRITFTMAIAPFVNTFGRVIEWIGEGLNWLFKIPILGNILSGIVVGFVSWITILGTIKMLVAGITLLMGNLGTTSGSSLAKNVLGWRNSTFAAREYLSTLNMIKLQEMGYMGYNPKLFRGTGGYFVRTAGGYKSFKDLDKYSQYASKAYPTITAAGAAGTLLNKFGKPLIGPAVTKGFGAMLKGGALKALGFIGGPWGILTLSVLPGIITGLARVIKGNTGAQEENNNLLREDARTGEIAYEQAYRHQVRYLSDYSDRLYQYSNLASDIKRGKRANMQGLGITSSNTEGVRDIVINIGNETVFRTSFNKIARDQFNQVGLPLSIAK